MSDRITDSMLNARVKRLNELTQSPAEPYSRIDGKNVANIGNFHLSHAYGGVCLHRMYNDGGGVTTPIISYHTNKRHLHDLINAYMDGIMFALENVAETV